jgi:hypothetical protein
MVVIGDAGQAIGFVVDVGGGLVFGVGDGFEQAVFVIAVAGRLPEGADLFDLSIRQIVFEGRGIVFGIDQPFKVAACIVFKFGQSATRIQLIDHPPQRVVGIVGHLAARIGTFGDLPLGVAFEIGRESGQLVEGGLGADQPTRPSQQIISWMINPGRPTNSAVPDLLPWCMRLSKSDVADAALRVT